MQTNKALSPNSILTKTLKMSQQIIAKPLVHLFNLSFSTWVFPDLLKIANVIPIFKKGDSQDYNNYRPVSLVSNLSKLIEKITHKRIYNFLEKHSLLFEKQYGFCTKMSTNHAVIDMTANVLLHKLNYFGVRGSESNWFKSYLGTRQQCK